jgi:N6-adenosine-specific RNA methylase IME4
VRGASVKPEEVTDEIMRMVPKSHYLQLYARYNNLRPNMVCVGNQLKSPNVKDEET